MGPDNFLAEEEEEEEEGIPPVEERGPDVIRPVVGRLGDTGPERFCLDRGPDIFLGLELGLQLGLGQMLPLVLGLGLMLVVLRQLTLMLTSQLELGIDLLVVKLGL